jgi:hypothetical protein
MVLMCVMLNIFLSFTIITPLRYRAISLELADLVCNNYLSTTSLVSIILCKWKSCQCPKRYKDDILYGIVHFMMHVSCQINSLHNCSSTIQIQGGQYGYPQITLKSNRNFPYRIVLAHLYVHVLYSLYAHQNLSSNYCCAW